MKLGKRTAKLVHEAIVLAHVEGAHWAGYSGGGEGYPRDSDVVAHVLRASKFLGDLYPTLSKVAVAALDTTEGGVTWTPCPTD
jgi:hypothetical protein